MTLDFKPPKPSIPFIRLVQWLNSMILTKKMPVVISKDNLELFNSLPKGASILIAPNHADSADCFVALELSRQLNRPFTYMSARETFDLLYGLVGKIFQWMGVFSVVRGGENFEANKAAKNILKEGKFPLVIFPEGEIHLLNDRIMPIKPGVALFALEVAQEHEKGNLNHPGTFIIPAGFKYKYRNDNDIVIAIEKIVERMEKKVFELAIKEQAIIEQAIIRQATIRNAKKEKLYDRIYRLGEILLSLKEKELKLPKTDNDIYCRIDKVRKTILSALEMKHFNKEWHDDDLDRARRLIVHIMEKLLEDGNSSLTNTFQGYLGKIGSIVLQSFQNKDEKRSQMEHDLEETWFAARLVSFAHDYLREHPTIERTAETIKKLEREIFGLSHSPQIGERQVFVRIGKPIDVREYLLLYKEKKGKKSTILSLTGHVQNELQLLIDTLNQ